MKLFYHREDNYSKYHHALMMLENLDIDIRDNLYKMAIHILKGSRIHKLHEVAHEAARIEGNKSKSLNIS